ncbi:hypothetical protein CDL15_Pgr003434 [Punica granatum]|nr:hypothetical protein CDL15_Pgr003434 [Punica granatum]PKH69544.1 hypothetical protein CRG98_050089 [Punica granatum]
MVSFLHELPRVRTEDVLNPSPKNFKSLEIREILAAAGAGAGAVQVPAEARCPVPKSRKARVWHFVNSIMEYRGNWMNEQKGSLMMVSSIIATCTFQAAIAPPGGVWQNDTTMDMKGYCKNSTDSMCSAGKAVLSYYYPGEYYEFMKYNMVSFLGSLVVLFLVISGFPLSHKFCLWLLCLVMSGTVTCLGFTFFKAMWLVVPSHMTNHYDELKNGLYIVWAVTACIVGLFLLVRMCFWLKRFVPKGAWFTTLKLDRADSSGHARKPEPLC